jgi:hypothetical protein
MKKLVFSILLAFSLVSISTTSLMSAPSWGSSSNIGGEINVPKAGMFDPLIQIYNKIIVLVKKAVESNMKKVVKSATQLLGTMAGAYIIVMGARSFLSGSQFLSSVMEKMFGFLCLLALLQFSWYDKYILSNLENLFNNLPTLFNSGGGGDVITNIISQTSSLTNKVWTAIGNIGWGLKVISIIAGAFAIGALTSLTLVVLINVLILTVEFYFVLSISSILILLFFFKFTRSLSMGAVQIVFGAILKVTLLSLFLNLFGGIIEEALVFDGEREFFASCMGIILISAIGIVLIKVVNDIANRITGGVGQMAGANMPHMGNMIKNLIGK